MRCGTVLLIALFGMPTGARAQAKGADGPPPGGATRVVEGRCLDEAGQPPRDARIGFSPSSPTTSPSGTWSTRIAADGSYRVELASYTDPNSGEVVAPNGALRFHVLATGFRVDSGQVEGGSGAAAGRRPARPRGVAGNRDRTPRRRRAARAGR